MGKAYRPSYFKYPGMIFKRMMTGKNILPKVLIALFIVIYLLTEILSPIKAYALNFDSSTVSVRNDGGDFTFSASDKGSGWVRVRMTGQTPDYTDWNSTFTYESRWSGLSMSFGLITPYYSNYYDEVVYGNNTSYNNPRDKSNTEMRHSGGKYSSSSGSGYTFLKGGEVTFSSGSGIKSFSTKTTWEHSGTSSSSTETKRDYLNSMSGQYEVISYNLTKTSSHRYSGEDYATGYSYDITVDVKINNGGKNGVGLTPVFYVVGYAEGATKSKGEYYDKILWESSHMATAAEMMNTVTVTFNGNNGSDGGTVTGSPNETKTAPKSTRTGYNSNGWYTQPSGGTFITADGGTYTQPSSDVTYYAQWSPINYTIKFNGNGGTVSSESQKKAYDSTLGTLPTAERKGYDFKGWYTASINGTKIASSTKVSGDANYYAQWSPRSDTQYKVEHYQQNVTGSGYTLADTESKTGESDSSVTPSVKTYTGFTSPKTQTQTISADGSRVFKYYYTRNKYPFTLGTDTGVSTSGSTVTGSYYYGQTITLKATPLNGYKFDKWADGNTNQSFTFTMPAQAVTKTPEVHPITYTITYNLNSGRIDYKKTFYNVETPTFYIENPTKKGFSFSGWTGTGISGATTDLSVPLGSYGNKTFTATWGNGVYTINFDGNGHTGGSMEAITVKSGESVTLPQNGFIKDGYSFVGWYTTKHDMFGTFYKNGAVISDLSESITLRAQWKKIRNTDREPYDNPSGGDDGHGSNSGDDTEIIPNDELGYFGTAKRTNEISIRTTNGMKDKKLTLNYNY